MSDNANVPKQVLEQVERLDALHAQLNPQPEGSTQQPNVEPPVATTVVAAATDNLAPPTTPDPDPAPPAPERTDWKAKYHVLKGKFDAEVPRYAAENRVLRNTVQELTDEVNKLKASAAPAGNTAPIEGLEAQFDPDLVRYLREQIRTETQPLKAELEATREVQTKSAHERFVESVTELVPDYAEIDATDEFQEWASDLDMVSGHTYGELLNDAILKQNAARVKVIYDKFKSTRKVSRQPAADSQGKPFIPAPLETRAVPLPSADAAVNMVEKPNFTRAQVAKFFGDLARGLYKGREAEAAAIEAQIALAQSEGRVE